MDPASSSPRTENTSAKRSPDSFSFFRGFLKEPRQVGSIIPSSPILERRLSTFARVPSARRIVELGPGTGGTTRALLRHMTEDAALMSIEANPLFIDRLQQIDDPRLAVQHGDALQVRELLNQAEWNNADLVISGIPFSTMDQETGRKLIADIHSLLSPNGAFVAYQIRDRVCNLAKGSFGRPDKCTVWRNIPPLRIFRWEKTAPVKHRER
ncbi:class I SAM-dependent methyltransferase [Thalassoroseus pseudoceratinae]|uniref:class I SAM-dependent methyltransferase n=1 Tax=Thalassoroseus pseudoceratinae TaxID=2713176 RepID=UPI00142171D5|nr:methyltransferase domain-containing protein [Thalassoroseus pseudoceratinae]